MTWDASLPPPPDRTLGARVQDALYFAMFHVLRHAPVDVVSDIGSRVVRWSVPRNRPWVLEGARKNLRRLRPDLDDAGIERAVTSFLDNVGRMMAEFTALPCLHAAGRIETTPMYKANLPLVYDEPTIAIVPHTGNWEVCAAVLHAHGVSPADFAIPPETWAQQVIAAQVRAELGVRILPLGTAGLRAARRELRTGGLVSIFCDEARGGLTMGPLFGREPHARGNLAVAAWLARDTGARLVVVHCRRQRKSRFVVDSSEYFHLPEPGPKATRTLDDVATINAVMEPIILANLDQWYFLDNDIVDLGAEQVDSNGTGHSNQG